MINLTLPRGDRFTSDAPAQIEKAFRTVDSNPLAETVLVGPVAIGVADTRVFHGLGRRPRGFQVADASADVRVFRGAVGEVTDPANHIVLRASSAQTVTLLVF